MSRGGFGPDGTTGVVLAGGRGSRLDRLTRRTSKQLLPVGGRPLVAHVLRQLVSAGVVDVLLVIDERHASAFLAELRDGHELGLRSLAYVWQPAAAEGLPSAIGKVEHQLKADRFLVACGDVLTDADLGRAVEDFGRQRDGARVIATHVGNTAGQTTVEVEDGIVVSLGDKDPARTGPGLMDLGLYLYRDDVFDEIRQLRRSARGETEIWDLNRRYLAERRLACTEVSGWWADVGTSEDTYHAVDRRYTSCR